MWPSATVARFHPVPSRAPGAGSAPLPPKTGIIGLKRQIGGAGRPAGRTGRRGWRSVGQRWDRVRGRVQLLVAVIAAITLYYVLPFDAHGVNTTVKPIQVIVAVVVFLLLATLIARTVRMQVVGGGREVRIQGLIFLVVLVVLFFSTLYVGMAGQFDGLASKTDALYFTVSTLGTVGFGDVHATGQAARIAVTTQMVFDLVYVAALVSVISGILRERAAASRRVRTDGRRANGDDG